MDQEHKKSAQEAGKEYEKSVLETLENDGYICQWNGDLYGYSDMGADIIVTLDNATVIIQCKRWTGLTGSNRKINQSVVLQLMGSMIYYRMARHVLHKCYGLIVHPTSDITPGTRELADLFSIGILDNYDINDRWGTNLRELQNRFDDFNSGRFDTPAFSRAYDYFGNIISVNLDKKIKQIEETYIKTINRLEASLKHEKLRTDMYATKPPIDLSHRVDTTKFDIENLKEENHRLKTSLKLRANGQENRYHEAQRQISTLKKEMIFLKSQLQENEDACQLKKRMDEQNSYLLQVLQCLDDSRSDAAIKKQELEHQNSVLRHKINVTKNRLIASIICGVLSCLATFLSTHFFNC